MDFAKLKKKDIKRSFEYEGEKVEYTITGGFMTASFIHVLSNLQQENNFKGLAQELANAITSWNLDYNGEPFPPTFKTLSEGVPFDFLGEIVEDLSAVFTEGGKTPKE